MVQGFALLQFGDCVSPSFLMGDVIERHHASNGCCEVSTDESMCSIAVGRGVSQVGSCQTDVLHR
jgi:hypothetical protein